MPRRFNVTTAIPYVNAPPHLGFALELVQADVLARHRRSRGWAVRYQTGTDDNSLKNVQASEAAGVPVGDLVAGHAATYAGLRETLDLSFDDFISTSRDRRHRPGLERLWRACDEAGDLYRKHYEGLYCVGCEQFYVPAELTAAGECPDHGTPPETVAEENWFFRLSRYEALVHDAITSGRLRIEPEGKRKEALAFIAGGLDDFSVSRSVARARGWGIPVPDHPNQVIYVWFDALANYITALDFGAPDAAAYRRWWHEADRRVHVIGKGVLRFHAVYWPAILLSAGLPLPTDILVHDYLTVDGRKLSKSSDRSQHPGHPVDPAGLAGRYGADALRWWLVRDVPRSGDVDFTIEGLVNRANDDLANGIGNLASRVATVVHRYRDGLTPAVGGALRPVDQSLLSRYSTLSGEVDRALDAFDVRGAAVAIVDAVAEANRYIETVQPWGVARAEGTGDGGATRRLDTVLGLLVHTCRAIAAELGPFVPGLSARLIHQFGGAAGRRLPPPERPFPRLP